MMNSRLKNDSAGLPSQNEPKNLLLPDEIAKLQDLAATLNHLYEQLSPIAEAWQEREDMATIPHRCISCVAISQCPEWTFLPKYRSTALYPESVQWESGRNISVEENKLTISACLSRIGRRGISGNNHIYAILWSLQSLTDSIENLLHTGSLQRHTPVSKAALYLLQGLTPVKVQK